MQDAPAVAVRQKKRSSMRVCFDLAKAGEVEALVSAGNSGAMMACGLFVLGRSAGVERPAIVTTFPTMKGQCALLRHGGQRRPPAARCWRSSRCWVRSTRGCTTTRRRPKVGLLSNGAEEHKGTALTRETHQLLVAPARPPEPIAGRVRLHRLRRGPGHLPRRRRRRRHRRVHRATSCSRASRAWPRRSSTWWRPRSGRGSLLEKLGALLMRPALRRFRRKTDYAETGGAPLLGVEGVALICHGGSDARAMKNAILAARRFAQLDLARELRRGGQRTRLLVAGATIGPARDLGRRYAVVRSRIVGTGRGVPEKVLTNADLEKMVDTSDAWIVERTGIRERRILDKSRATSDLATEAGPRPARPRASIPSAIDCIIVGTVTPDTPLPGHRGLRAAEAGRPARRRGLRPVGGLRRLHLRPGHRRRVHRRGACSSACSSSGWRSCRASSTGRTATPACCSATAPARPCWSPEPEAEAARHPVDPPVRRRHLRRHPHIPRGGTARAASRPSGWPPASTS